MEERAEKGPTEQLLSEIESLKARNRELEEKLEVSEGTLRAIQSGEVDAILVSTDKGERIFTLRGAEEPYRVLFEEMNEGAVIVSEEGSILYCNQSFATAMRSPLERVFGADLEDFLLPCDLATYQELLKESIRGAVRRDVVLVAADGAQVPMQLAVSYLPEDRTYCMVAYDLSERIQAEEALREAYKKAELMVLERTKELTESEAKYRGLFDSMAEAFELMELVYEGGKPVDYIFLDVNPAWERMTGLKKSDVLGRRASEVGGFVEGYWQEAMDRALRTGEMVHIEDYGIALDRWYSMDMWKFSENACGVTITDITERKRQKERLEKYAEDLARSNAELQQFAYVASHDLQEPLRMITSYLGLLQKKFGHDLNPQAKEYMSFAVDGSQRMKRLIDDLLQYSRVDSQPIVLEEVDMNELAKVVGEDHQVAIGETEAELIVDPLPVICADKTQMKQLLTNLVSNAIKFHDSKPPRVEVSAITYQREFVFSVKDNGIGIDPRYKEKLFKMFSRLHTRDEYPGTGIGLAITKKIVERHGGRIWFESEPGKGTTFFFTIPQCKNEKG